MSRVLRWARSQPVTVVGVVATLALGIGAATAVYAVVEAVVVRALPVRDPARLVWLWNARVERDRAPFSVLDLYDYRTQNTVLEGLAPFINCTANLTGTVMPSGSKAYVSTLGSSIFSASPRHPDVSWDRPMYARRSRS